MARQVCGLAQEDLDVMVRDISPKSAPCQMVES